MKSQQLRSGALTGAPVVLLALALMLPAFLSCSGGGKSKDLEVVMVINGSEITQRQITEAADLFRRQQMVMSPEMALGGDEELRRGTARGIAGNMLMLDEIKAKGWQADPAVVDMMAARFIAQFPSREEFEAQIAAFGESEESMRKGMAEEILLDSLMRTVSANVPPVDTSEALAHYEANKSRYVVPGKIRASQILFALAPDASDSLVRAAVLRAGEAHAKASAGEDFDKLVKEYSSLPETDMGWFARGELIPDLERTLFTLKTGEVGGPVPSGMGLHLLKKTGEEAPRQMAFEEASGGIWRSLTGAKQAKAVNDYISGLIDAANIEFRDPALDFKAHAKAAEAGASAADGTGDAATSAAYPSSP